MLNRLYIFILFAVSIIAFSGCEDMISDVDIKLPDEKLVVTSFITPDLKYTTVRIWKSKPLFTDYLVNEDKFLKIADAVVSLSSEDGTVILPYDSIHKNYRISKYRFPIIAGKTYHLKVVTKDGIIANSSCTVPSIEPPAIECTSFDSIITGQQLLVRSNVRFKDIEGNGNNYTVTVSKLFYMESRSEPLLENIGFNNTLPYFSDEDNDSDYYNLQTNDIKINQDEITRLYFTISVTDDHYYHYHKTIIANDTGNPFSEPTPLYSNINGGLGIFAAYVQKTHVVDLN